MDLTNVPGGAPPISAALGQPSPVPQDSTPLAPQPGDVQVVPLDTQAGTRQRALEDEAALAPKPDMWDTAAAAYRNSSLTRALVNSVIDRFHGPELQPDPSYRLDPEWVKQEAGIRGIPEEATTPLKDATSQGDATRILDDIAQSRHDTQTLAQAGIVGVAADGAVSLLDPVALATNIASGGAGTLYRGARIARIVKSGLAVGVSNAAMEAYVESQRYRQDPSEVAMAGFMGFAMGGVMGGLSKAENTVLRKAGENGYTDVQLSRLKADGIQLTPEGEARLAAAQQSTDTTEPFLAGSIGSAQIEPIEGVKSAFNQIKIPFTNKTFSLRFDYAAIFDRSPLETMRDLGNRLLADGVGKEGGYAASMNASEFAALHQNMFRGKFYQAAGDSYSAYADRMGYNWWQRNMSSQEATNFFHDVTAAVRGDADVAARNPEAAQLGQKVSQIHADMLQKLKDFGVAGADEVMPNPQYMMRKFNYDNIRKMRDEHGPARLNDLVSRALQSARSDLTREKADTIAAAYVDKVRRMQYDKSFHSSFATAADKENVAAALKGKLNPDEHQVLMELLDTVPETPKEPGVASPRLKPRTKLDENFAMNYTGKDGVEKSMKISDLFENDARNLFDQYTRQTTGLMGLAKVGIKSPEDWAAARKAVEDEAMDKNMAGDVVTKQLEHLDNVFNYIRGVPMSNQPFGKLERAARVLRDVNFMRMMGQSGAAQLVDATNMIGLAGWRAFSTQIPSVADIVKMAKGGLLDDKLARDLANIGGFGTEGLAHNPMWRDISEMNPSAGMSKIERATNLGAHGVSWASGLQSIDHVEKTVASRVISQKFSDLSRGITEITPAMRRSLATAGLAEDDLDKVLARMKMHSEVEGDLNKLTGIDHEAWQKQSPESYDKFQMALFRETYRAIQAHTIGETSPLMHSTIGKILTQFRSFSIVAYNKQLLYGVNHMSPAVVAAWSLSTLMGSLQYVALTHLNFANDEAEREKRLDPVQIALAGFNKAGYSSILPGLLDTTTGLTTGREFFKNARTSGLDAGFITGNPTYDLVVNKIGNTVSAASQSALTNDYVWTQKDVKNMLGALPNLYGYRNFTHAMSSDFPKTNFLRQGQPHTAY